jgi:hypothetical protein
MSLAQVCDFKTFADPHEAEEPFDQRLRQLF